MTDEPTTQPINEDDNEPATKGDIRRAVDELERQTETKFDAVLSLIKEEAKQTRQHFDVVAENIHKDVGGANQDEITLLKDQKIPDHEKRIQTIEEKVGVPVGPRY